MFFYNKYIRTEYCLSKDLYCSGEENIHNAETQQQISRLEQRRTQIEKKKKNICEKTAKIKKQEDIYTNLGYAGIGLIALGLAPVSGPAMAGELGLGTAKIAGTVAVSDAATVGAATAGALGTTYHSSNIIGTATGTNPVESYIYNGDTETFREDTALLDNINMTSSAYGIIGAGSKTGEEAVENLGERYDWGSESGSKAAGNIAKNLDTNNIPNMTKQEIIDAIPDNWKYTENNGFVHIKDEAGKIRIRIDPPDKVTQYPHVHVYDNDGNLLDSLGNIVDRKSPDGHIPYKN